jgi:hypothetical protein
MQAGNQPADAERDPFGSDSPRIRIKLGQRDDGDREGGHRLAADGGPGESRDEAEGEAVSSIGVRRLACLMGIDQLAETLPAEMERVEQSLQVFLDQLDEIGGIAGDLLAADGIRTWLTGAAFVAVAGVLAHQVSRRRRTTPDFALLGGSVRLA